MSPSRLRLRTWFRGKELSFAFGINLMLARFGTFLAQTSPTWARSAYASWRTPLLIAVGFASLCVIGAIIYWILEAWAERNYELGHAGGTDKVVFSDVFKFDPSYWYVVALCITFYSAIFPFRTHHLFTSKFLSHGRAITYLAAQMGGNLLGMLTASPCSAMIATPLFGLLADRMGKRATLMIVGSLLMMPVYLMMAYSSISLLVPVSLMGIAFSLIPAVMWPSVAYIVDERRLGTAYALMSLLQQIGFFSFNLAIGKANDISQCRAHRFPRLCAGNVDLLDPGLSGIALCASCCVSVRPGRTLMGWRPSPLPRPLECRWPWTSTLRTLRKKRWRWDANWRPRSRMRAWSFCVASLAPARLLW